MYRRDEIEYNGGLSVITPAQQVKAALLSDEDNQTHDAHDYDRHMKKIDEHRSLQPILMLSFQLESV